MRVGIVGQRDYPDLAQVKAYVDALPVGTVVVTGDCPTGADQAARAACAARGWVPRVHVARWREFGWRAGPARNGELVGDVDRLVAFYVDGSRKFGEPDGTMDTVRKARMRGVPVEVLGPTPAGAR